MATISSSFDHIDSEFINGLISTPDTLHSVRSIYGDIFLKCMGYGNASCIDVFKCSDRRAINIGYQVGDDEFIKTFYISDILEALKNKAIKFEYSYKIEREEN